MCVTAAVLLLPSLPAWTQQKQQHDQRVPLLQAGQNLDHAAFDEPAMACIFSMAR
jgi:hypothetical protein